MRYFRFVLLDLGGLLYKVEYHRTAEALGLAPHTITQLLHDPILADYEKGLISTQDFLSAWQSRFPHLILEQIVKAWNAMLLGPLPSAEAILKELHAQFPLAILSNTNDLHLTIVEPEIQPWRKYLAGLFFSNRIHRRKPDPEAYLYALNQLQWRAEEALFVDDNPENVEGAQRAGLYACLMHPPNQPERLLEIIQSFRPLANSGR
ncbi:MAG: HAD-IA family hydrolase [Bacteroidia bacterium]|nr:HAD-IA family hydrolase [Bacteroidia bacterium]